MLEAQSALSGLAPVAREGFGLRELRDFTLTQLAGPDKELKKVLGRVPAKIGEAMDEGGRKLLRVGARQLWVLGAAPQASAADVHHTPLSSSRVRIEVSGPLARSVLAASAAIDFRASQFKPGHVVLTGIHHTPVLIHCVEHEVFHVYAMRSFAVAVWEWLADAADGSLQTNMGQ